MIIYGDYQELSEFFLYLSALLTKFALPAPDTDRCASVYVILFYQVWLLQNPQLIWVTVFGII